MHHERNSGLLQGKLGQARVNCSFPTSRWRSCSIAFGGHTKAGLRRLFLQQDAVADDLNLSQYENSSSASAVHTWLSLISAFPKQPPPHCIVKVTRLFVPLSGFPGLSVAVFTVFNRLRAEPHWGCEPILNVIRGYSSEDSLGPPCNHNSTLDNLF